MTENYTYPEHTPTMHNLNFWTFEHGKFKVLRIYMDTYPYRQALSHVLGSSDTEVRQNRMAGE